MKTIFTFVVILTSGFIVVFNTIPYFQANGDDRISLPPLIASLQEKCNILESPDDSDSMVKNGVDIKKITEAYGIITRKKVSPSKKVRKKTKKIKSRPTVKTAILSTVPKLSGIVWIDLPEGRDGSLAILDGKNVRTGDMVSGWKVKRIDKNGVTLSRNGETRFLKTPDVAFNIWTSDN